MKPSPFAPSLLPILPPIAGVKLATFATGIRYKGRDDLLLAVMPEGTNVAGCFTRSLTASYNVIWGREHVKDGKGRVLVVNAGNANAFNGRYGKEAVERIAAHAATLVGCTKEEVFPCSTGVIGVRLPDDRITCHFQTMMNHASPSAWEASARAIMTTDTFPKLSSRQATIGTATVSINGFAKGSGMIAPNMATMLAYVFTDASLPAAILTPLFKQAVDRSFNSITVDGDTSTSDTAIMFATNQAQHPSISSIADPVLTSFTEALEELLMDLARQVVEDGEGITKAITIDITGAASEEAARKIGLSIGNSPLVKTAIAGEDANWGRIVMAVGKAYEAIDISKLNIAIGGISIVKHGELDPSYQEALLIPHMKGNRIHIEVDVGVGKARSRVLSCDLTHGYIDINADYRS